MSQSQRFSDQSSLLASWGPWPGPGSCWVLQVTLAPRPCWNWRLGRGEEDCRYQRRTSSTPAPKTSMPGWTRGRDEMLCNGSRTGTGFVRDTWPSARTTNVAAPDTTKLAALLQLQGLPRRHVRPREGRNGSARASNSPWQRGSLQLLLRDDAPPNYVPAHWWCSSRCGASKRHSTAGACLSFHPQQTRAASTDGTHTHTHLTDHTGCCCCWPAMRCTHLQALVLQVAPAKKERDTGSHRRSHSHARIQKNARGRLSDQQTKTNRPVRPPLVARNISYLTHPA